MRNIQSYPSPALFLAAMPGVTRGTFTPTFTFATPGDLAVAYVTQSAQFLRFGAFVFVEMSLRFTPTFTSASGNGRFAGLPFPASNPSSAGLIARILTAMSWPAGISSLNAIALDGQSYLELRGFGNGIGQASFGPTQFPSATQAALVLSGCYLTDA